MNTKAQTSTRIRQTNVLDHDLRGYVGPNHAQSSKDAGLWHFGVVDSPDGVVLVLDVVNSRKDCLARTKTIAGSLNACYIVSGELANINVLLKHLESWITSKKRESCEEAYELITLISNHYPMLTCALVQEGELSATASAGDPELGKYPGNISKDARSVWDSVVTSTKYLEKTRKASRIAKWSVVTKMFLDKCNRLGIQPVEDGKKSKTLESLNAKYAQQRNLASMLERQVFSNMASEGLVEDYDRGVWKFNSVAYLGKRYAIVLETKCLAITNKPALIAKHLIDEEDFSKSDLGGWEHDVSPTCKLLLRMRKYPNISFRMILLFSKDILLGLGVTGRNREEVLESFEEIASDWARTRKFRRIKA